MSGGDDRIGPSDLEALRVARNEALRRVTEVLTDDRVDCDFDLLDRLWVEYRAAHEAYMEALGWDRDDHCGI